MPAAESSLLDNAGDNELSSFMNGYSGYDQICITKKDIHKTNFCCHLGICYQRVMKAIFSEMIGKFIGVYTEDIVVKTTSKPYP